MAEPQDTIDAIDEVLDDGAKKTVVDGEVEEPDLQHLGRRKRELQGSDKT